MLGCCVVCLLVLLILKMCEGKHTQWDKVILYKDDNIKKQTNKNKIETQAQNEIN